MDISHTIISDSTQMNADDLMSGSQTFTITKVTESSSADKKKQPLDFHLQEHEVPWRPCLTMRRLLVAMWGADASKYPGRKLTLFRDPDVQFGNAKVGGIRILQASHIDKEFQTSLTTTRGRKSPFTVQPLPDVSQENQTEHKVDEEVMRKRKLYSDAKAEIEKSHEYWPANKDQLKKELPIEGYEGLEFFHDNKWGTTA